MVEREWLESDGLGGFAMGTVDGPAARRYHGLLVSATTPPTGRLVLVNGLEAVVRSPAGSTTLWPQRYAPDVLAPASTARLAGFEHEPWPTWRFAAGAGAAGPAVEQQIFMAHGAPLTVVTWRLVAPMRGVTLSVRPFLSGRDYHGLHHENGQFGFDPAARGGRLVWRPYPGVPPVHVWSNGAYRHEPHWYRQFLYAIERQRGLECVEDLAAPGTFHFDLSAGEAVLVLGAEVAGSTLPATADAVALARRLRDEEAARRRGFATPLERAADCYVVRRGAGRTIIAGYPWFTDWGRDTFIAMRGLCLAGGRLEDARHMVLAWAGAVSQGMLPNLFPDGAGAPEYNAVDASLWYVVAVHEFLEEAARAGLDVTGAERATLQEAVRQIVEGYAGGTRFGIRRDADGLLAAGETGQQLTWMDARAEGREVTPRIGKPVEVQALWINALWAASQTVPRVRPWLESASASFEERFFDAERGCLYDVVDVDHRSGTVDRAIRPNQIFAVGGLPRPLLGGARAASVLRVVEKRLWTPLGLRTLDPVDPAYHPRYDGPPAQRDGAYHQGTAWPWLIGPFVEAWLRVHGDDAEHRRAARQRFLQPILDHLEDAGIGHVSEVADGDAPHRPGGCPFQAWSVGELMRALRLVSDDAPRPRRRNGVPSRTGRAR
jgi:predicted glycogen debranching enzyme